MNLFSSNRFNPFSRESKSIICMSQGERTKTSINQHHLIQPFHCERVFAKFFFSSNLFFFFVFNSNPFTSRFLICAYFLNRGASDLHWFFQGYFQTFPWLSIPLIICTLIVIANQRVYIFAWFLLFVSAKDAFEILYQQLYKWIYLSQSLYINELMVKKMKQIQQNDYFFQIWDVFYFLGNRSKSSLCLAVSFCYS